MKKFLKYIAQLLIQQSVKVLIFVGVAAAAGFLLKDSISKLSMQTRQFFAPSYSFEGSQLTINEVIPLRQWVFMQADLEMVVDTTWKVRFPAIWQSPTTTLCKIFYGHLEMGVDLSQSAQCYTITDSLVTITLPPVTLLNKGAIIDETRTIVFENSSEATPAIHSALCRRAERMMTADFCTPENIAEAHSAAQKHFTRLFAALGYKNIAVVFGE